MMMIANLHYVHMAAKFNPSLWQAFKSNMSHVGLTTFKEDSILNITLISLICLPYKLCITI